MNELTDLRAHYLEILARSLVGVLRPQGPDYRPIAPTPSWISETTEDAEALAQIQRVLSRLPNQRSDHRVELRRAIDVDEDLYLQGKSVDSRAFTMVGTRRLSAIREALLDTHWGGPLGSHGDYVEAGVWRGGSGIFAAEVCRWFDLGAHVFLYDTFRGFPTEAPSSPDFGDTHDQDFRPYVASLKDVRENFRRFAIPMERVHLVEGDVAYTSREHPERPIAVLRLDVDLYRPTYAALENLYPKLLPGGYVIVDDWNYSLSRTQGTEFPARSAVEDFAKERGIPLRSRLKQIDHMSVIFRKEPA